MTELLRPTYVNWLLAHPKCDPCLRPGLHYHSWNAKVFTRLKYNMHNIVVWKYELYLQQASQRTLKTLKTLKTWNFKSKTLKTLDFHKNTWKPWISTQNLQKFRLRQFSCLKSQPWPPSPLIYVISKKVFKFTCLLLVLRKKEKINKFSYCKHTYIRL